MRTLKIDGTRFSDFLGFVEEVSRQLLDLESVLTSCHPSNRREVRRELRAARRGEGPTLFDLLVEIIEPHSRLELA